MSKLTIRGIGVATLSAFAVALVAPGTAEAAVTWTKTANTTQNAYSVNAYRAKVGPSSTPSVSGYTNYSKTISIKNSAGTYVAQGVTSKWLGKGTYKVYSTFKYRKSVAYKATVNQTDSVTLNNVDNASCTVTSVDYYYDNFVAWCTADYNGYRASGDVQGPWVDVSVGDTVLPGSAAFDALVSSPYQDMTYTHPVQVTKYKYVYSNRYRYRYVTVKKIYNPPTASYTEFKAIVAPFDGGYGNTLAEVRAIIGSNGTRTGFTDYGDSYFYSYQWKNNVGSFISVGFWNGRAYFKTWYS